MTEAEVSELFYQLPIVVVVLVIVWHFVKVLQKRDDHWLESIRNRDTFFLAQLDKYEESSKEMKREVLEAFKENAAMTGRCIDVLEKVDKKLTFEDFEREHRRSGREGR